MSRLNLTLEECERWRNNPTYNPATGRPIKMRGKTYEKIVKECAKVYAEYIENGKIHKKNFKDIYEEEKQAAENIKKNDRQFYPLVDIVNTNTKSKSR